MIDFTETYRSLHTSVAENVLAVQAKGRCLVTLWDEGTPLKIESRDSRGRRRTVLCPYTIESSFLACDPRPDSDDFCRVEYGPDVEHLTATEAKKFVAAAKAGKSLFDIPGTIIM